MKIKTKKISPPESKSRREKILEGAGAWAAYYRANPHRFAKEYLKLELRLFQKIVLFMMGRTSNTVFIGSRGIGKTFLSAVFCVIQCILYPGTKICISSNTRSQSINVIEKIQSELMPASPELRAEISRVRVDNTLAQVSFHNTSYIKVVTASDSARGNRANVLLLDEFRLISKDVIDTVLRKFLTTRRMPKYTELTKAERQVEYEKEKNKTMWLSSAYFTDHWSYIRCTDTLRMMLGEEDRHFICGFPYQLSLIEGILDKDQVEDEMAETDFNEIKFSMEHEAVWYGGTDGSFFEFNSISKNRHIKYPMLPDKMAAKVGGSNLIRIPPKENGEVRILSSDIALMTSSKNKNDASSIFLNRMIPTKAGRYTSNFVYAESHEGLRTDDQALVIRKLFDEFECDYLVLDVIGLGLGVYDCLARDMVDPESGEIYPALSCYNNPELAKRCTVQGAEKVIWAITASAQFNSDTAFLLREGFISGRVRLLTTEYEAEDALSDIKGYGTLSPAEQMQFQLPYIHTTLLVDELTKLGHEVLDNRVRVFTKRGMRKDRFSSVSYNYFVANKIETEINKRGSIGGGASNIFIVNPPKVKKKNNQKWR